MNVNIVTYCNLKCPYCFAVDLWKSAGSRPFDKEISQKNLRVVLDFMKKSHLNDFRMFGGEPTLHSRFEEVYNTVTKSGFQVTIFSNGIIAKEKVDFLAQQHNLKSICINAQHPDIYTTKQRAMFDYSLSKLNKLINLSFVIYKTDFNAYFLIDFIKKYKLRGAIKWSIAAPSLKSKNVHIRIEDHKKVITGMLKHARVFKQHHLCWYPDTTFMWCFFTKAQLDELARNVGFKPVNLCQPVLEVAPNLTLYRCYGTASLSSPRLKITDFRNDREAYEYLSKKEMWIKKVGVIKECFRCNIKGKTCGAGCIAQILQSLPKKDYGYIYPALVKKPNSR